MSTEEQAIGEQEITRKKRKKKTLAERNAEKTSESIAIKTQEEIIKQKLEFQYFYPDNTDRTEQVQKPDLITYYETDLLSKEIINIFKEKAKEMKKTFVVFDWHNSASPAMLKKIYKDMPNTSFFIFLPHPDYTKDSSQEILYLNRKHMKGQILPSFLESMSSFSEDSTILTLCNESDYFIADYKSEQIKIGEFRQNTLKIYYDGFSIRVSKEINQDFSKIVENKLSDFSIYKKNCYEKEELISEISHAYKNYMKHYKNVAYNIYTGKINESNSRMVAQMQALVNLENTLYELSILREETKNRYNEMISRINLEIVKENLIALLNGKYTNIYLGSDSIIAHTSGIFLETYQKYDEYGRIVIGDIKRTYYIGTFEIEIKPDGTVRFSNLTNKFEDYDHPHVAKGIPCLGNIKNHLPKLIQRGDFLGVLMICHDFLCSLNESGVYRSVLNWKEVKSSRIYSQCKTCGLPTQICEGHYICHLCLNDKSTGCTCTEQSVEDLQSQRDFILETIDSLNPENNSTNSYHGE